LGRLTLETPEEFAIWLAEGKKADAERAQRKKPAPPKKDPKRR
jgi:ribosome biogenesis GTPase A